MGGKLHILITGAGGQLGQDMYIACQARGLPVTAANSGTLDITDLPAVRSFIRKHPCDVVINCAAYNAVDQAEKDWRTAFRVNGLGVRNLACAVNECGGILVHYSSDFVFDGKGTRPYTIADTPHPINRYGESKLLGEQFIRDLSENYFLIRVSWLFGKGNVNFAQKVVEWSKNSHELKVVDDQVASPTYTVDLASATLDLIDSDRFGLYHITNQGYCSRFTWASTILDAIGWNGTISRASSDEFPLPARRPSFSVLDNFGSWEALGYDLPAWQDATARYLRELSLT